jgi:hypothetical protein
MLSPDSRSEHTASRTFFDGPFRRVQKRGRRNEFRRNPPLCRGDGEEMPLAGHAFELVRAALLELKP